MVALSVQLTQVHQAMRDRVAVLRRAVADGNDTPRPLSADLLTQCLGFCASLHTHHVGEDSQLLPMLRAAAPELAPVIDNLIEDHALVAGLLRRIRDLLDPGQPPPDPGTLVRELDGLTAILDSHFGYEERRIARALDALGPEARIADVFDPPRSGANGQPR